jgi:hypothetical protein
MRAVRAKYGPTRFFCVGEYGEETGRPHFHAILFGLTFFDDGKPVGKDIYSSASLDKLWGRGFCSFGQVTLQSASYVAGYCLKKVSEDKRVKTAVDMRTGECVEIEPEMAHMSLKPGIGYEWFRKYWKEVYEARDGVVIRGGKIMPTPKYYDRLLEEIDADLLEQRRQERVMKTREGDKYLDNTWRRLEVREKVVLAGLAQKKRKL